MNKKVLLALALLLVLMFGVATAANAETTCALTVDAPNGTLVEIYKGSSKIASGTVSGTSKVFTIAQDTYSVKLRQGSAWFTFTPVNCNSATQGLDGLATLTVNAPNGTLVEVYKVSAKMTSGTVPSGDSLTLNVVQSDGLKVKLRQGSAWFEFPTNCGSGSCSVNALKTLTVEAPKGTLVEVYKGSAKTASGTVPSGDSLGLKVVKYGGYTVRLRQGSAWFSKTADCDTGTCKVEALASLGVTAPKNTLVEVYKGSAKVTSGTASSTLNLKVVKYDTYKVKLRQGSAWFEFPANCGSGSCSVNALKTLTVEAPKGTLVEVYKGSAKATSSTVPSGDSLDLKVVKYGGYTVKLRQGSAWFSKTADCDTGTCKVEALASLAVTAPKNTLVEVYKDSAKVTSGTASSTLNLKVVKYDKYKVRLRQGSAWFEFTGNNCSSGGCALNALCSIYLKAPRNTLVEVYKGSAKATSGTVGSSNDITLDVVKYNGYKVKMRVGSKWYQFTGVDAYSTCPADLSKSRLTVQIPGLSGIRVEMRKSGGGLVAYKNNQSGQAVFDLEYGTYDVVLKKGAKTKTVEDVFVLGHVTLGNLVSVLKLDYEGLTGVRLEIRTTSGGLMQYHNNQSGVKSYPVLRNHYNLVFKKGAKTKTVPNHDCTGASCAPLDFVADLVVPYQGLSGIRLEIRTDNNKVGSAGGLVEYHSCSRKVPRPRSWTRWTALRTPARRWISPPI